MAGALKARVGGAWTYVKGIKGDTGPAGPPSVGLTTLTSNFDQTIRQTGPAGGPFTLLFRRNKEAYLNDRNDIDATGATDMAATITTYLSEYASNNVWTVILDGGSAYKINSAVTIPANLVMRGAAPHLGRPTGAYFFAGAAMTNMLCPLNDSKLLDFGIELRGLATVGIYLDNVSRVELGGLGVSMFATNNSAIRGGNNESLYIHDIVANNAGTGDTTYIIDLQRSWASNQATGYYGSDNGTVIERCGLTGAHMIRVSGNVRVRDCDLEGVPSGGPYVVLGDTTSSGTHTFVRFEDNYFELQYRAADDSTTIPVAIQAGGNELGVFRITGNKFYGNFDGIPGSAAIKFNGVAAGYTITGNSGRGWDTGVLNPSIHVNFKAMGIIAGNDWSESGTVNAEIAGGDYSTSRSGHSAVTPQFFQTSQGVISTAAIAQGVFRQTEDAFKDLTHVDFTEAAVHQMATTGTHTVTPLNTRSGHRHQIYFENANTTLPTASWNLLSGVDETPPAGTWKEFVVDSAGVVREFAHVRVRAGGGTPTIAAGTGAGTSPTVSVSGADTAGTITVTTGTSPAASATVATVTFTGSYGAAPKSILIDPCGANSAALTGTGRVYEDQASRTATTFALKVGSTALAASTTYTFSYQTIG